MLYKKMKDQDLHYWYHYDNRNNPDQNYDEDPEHFEKWKKENETIQNRRKPRITRPAADHRS